VTRDSTPSTSPLPEFERPPVAEVALSLAFEPIDGYTSAHTGRFWTRLPATFARVEEQAPYEIPDELESIVPEQRRVQVLPNIPPPRIWLLTADANNLIQIQPDGFFRNWRRAGSGESYPRYQRLRELFKADLTHFDNFVNETFSRRIVPTRCEITYVNHIPSGDGWNNFGDIDKIVSCCASPATGAFLPQPEECTYETKFPIRNEPSGHFLGRLTVSVKPAFRREDKHPLFVMTLSARGKPLGPGLSGGLNFLDIGHEWIVRGFADLTTKAMQNIWRRLQ
jgi:uncharacterized protein (TIGR04255 family)